MKRLYISIGMVVCVLCTSATAQEPVALSDWWSIEAPWLGAVFSYLPDFDTANGGLHTLAVYTDDGSGDTLSSTWYNRYYKDTVNQFSWYYGTETQLTGVDLNNDGARDYIGWSGQVYRGITDKAPPDPRYVAKYDYAIVQKGVRRIVLDANNDGYNDVICPQSDIGGNNIFTLFLGGPDLTKLMYIPVKKRPEYGYGEYFLGALSKQPGDTTVKIVTMSYEEVTVDNFLRKKWFAIVLRQMKVENVGDTVNINFTTLDSLWFKGYEAGREMSYGSSVIFTNHLAGKEYLLAREIRADGSYTVAYEFLENRIKEITSFRTDNRSTIILGNDINGDGYDDWATQSGNILYFYRGLREGVDSVPFAKYRLDAERVAQSEGITILGISDVTGDGVGDMALGYNTPHGRFSIIKGESILPVGVEQPVAGYTPAQFTMAQNYPNPAARNETTILPVSIQRSARYTLDLYDLHGRFVATLFDSDLPTGSHQITIELRQYNLSPGFYALRLTDGEQSRERGLLLH